MRFYHIRDLQRIFLRLAVSDAKTDFTALLSKQKS